MQTAAFRALEFDRIREALADCAATTLGHARALALEPSADPAEVARRLDRSAAAMRFVADAGSLALDAPDALPDILVRLDVADEPLDPQALLGLARFLDSVEDVTMAMAKTAGRSLLADLAARAPSFFAEIAAIRRAIEPSGDVSDRASAALADIREALRRARARLRSMFEGLVRGRETAKYLQDQIVTDRNGRYVLVVRAEHRDAIPGLVHGSSASGASLYLEPMATVEANNDVVALAGREAEEVRRILLALTNAFRTRAVDLETLVDVAADIDELHATAALARRLGAVVPSLATDDRIEFLGARHPLLRGSEVFSTDRGGLVPEVNGRPLAPNRPDLWKTPPTPSDLIIVPPVTTLVISGPNTGGKTVALKAIGLLALMAQAGLPIPVESGSTFTPFRSIFADIGDDQSIAQSLSTFSARVANIVGMDRSLELPALVLLDEVGSGTDPAEGAALGTAIIEHFRRRGALVVATTHDEALKSYAATTAGVATAAFGFDPATYAPTYRLIYGAPGRSLAFEIAERLGLPATVIADARSRRSGRESLLADHLARIDRELAAVDRDRADLDAARAALAADRDRLLARESRLAEREAVLKRRLDDRLNEKLKDAREEVDRIVGRLRQKADVVAERRGPALSTGDLGGLRSEGRAALEEVTTTFGLKVAESAPADRWSEPPGIGAAVFITTFGTEGIVRAVGPKDVEVEIRGKRARVPLEHLRRVRDDGGASASGRPAARPRTSSSSPGGSRPTELVLIGLTVDDALDRIAKFLDDALLGDERRLRIVHGHGTGRLREAVRGFFRPHPLVASVTPAPDGEGGDGATIVELKD